MKVWELVEVLQTIMEEHGDLEIVGDQAELQVEVMQENEEFDKCLYIG